MAGGDQGGRRGDDCGGGRVAKLVRDRSLAPAVRWTDGQAGRQAGRQADGRLRPAQAQVGSPVRHTHNRTGTCSLQHVVAVLGASVGELQALGR